MKLKLKRLQRRFYDGQRDIDFVTKKLKSFKVKSKKSHALAVFYQRIDPENKTVYKKTIKDKLNRRYREMYAAQTIVTGNLLPFNNTRTSRPVLYSEKDNINIPEIEEKQKKDLKEELEEKIAEFKADFSHSRAPNNLGHLRSRISSSIDIYEDYVS